jgi:hypothetical protein
MSSKRKPDAKPTSAARTRAYRERMRARGLKPVTIWTFDVDDPAFQKELDEACRRINESPDEKAVMDEFEAFERDLGLPD